MRPARRRRGASPTRAGEGAALVAEELGLDEVRRARRCSRRRRTGPSRAGPPRGATRRATSLPVPVSPSMTTGHVDAREALAERIEAAHLGARAERRPKRSRAASSASPGAPRAALDREAWSRRRGRSRRREVRVDDADAVDEGAVGRAEIGEAERRLDELERDVAARDRRSVRRSSQRGSARRGRARAASRRTRGSPRDPARSTTVTTQRVVGDPMRRRRSRGGGWRRLRGRPASTQDITLFRLRNARRRARRAARRDRRRASESPPSQRVRSTSVRMGLKITVARPNAVARRRRGRCRRRRTSSASSCRRRGHNCGSAGRS